MHIKGTTHRLETNAAYTPNRPNWMLLVGLGLGFCVLQFLFTQPMIQELALLRKQVSVVKHGLGELVDVSEQVIEANNLLASLKAQQRHVEDARNAVSTIQQFRKDVEAESAKTTTAFKALDQLLSLQGTLIEQRTIVGSATESLDEIVKLQQQLADQQATLEVASKTMNDLVEIKRLAVAQSDESELALEVTRKFGQLQAQLLANQLGLEASHRALQTLVSLKNGVLDGADGLESAQFSVGQFAKLKSSLLAESTELEAAQAAAAKFVALKNHIENNVEGIAHVQSSTNRLLKLKDQISAGSENIQNAEEAAQSILALKDEIASRGADTQISFENANQLFALRDQLADETNLQVASDNLTSLISIEQKLTSQTQNVADAMQTLEILTDLGDEVGAHVRSLGEMRRSLVEIVLLETTVRRALRVVQPLMQLGDLRRMSDREVREAARVILDQRQTRLSKRSVKSDGNVSEKGLPNESELFNDGTDDFINRLVPLPPNGDRAE